MTRVGGPWLDRDETQAVLRLLEAGGHRALLVGGCVRNALLDVPVTDIDVATDARPETVLRLAKAAELKSVPTGLAHGTVTLVVAGRAHEITTFRRDVATDGRRATVAFSDRVEDDAKRRDFTMNALYATRDGQVIDPAGGLPDLMARRLRFVGDAARRIREDYLRILRLFRFHAWYGAPDAGLDAEALAAAAANVGGLGALSRERVGAEIVKLLAAPDPAPSLAAMAQAGVLAAVLPGAQPAPLAPLVHVEGIAGVAADAMRRLAALGAPDDPQAALRLSRAAAARLLRLREGIGAGAGTAELAYRHGLDEAIDVELLRAAVFEAPLSASLFADAEAGAAARFPVTAADLMPEYQGADLGRRLAELEAEWIASGFKLDRAALLG